MKTSIISPLELNRKWEIKYDGFEKEQLEKNLKHIDEEGKNKIFGTAAEILQRCPSPNESAGGSTILALGKVQSGKTSSFISLTALAFDNNYRIVIILAGTKKNLADQTKRRLHSLLNIDDRDDRKIASVTTAGRIDDVQEKEIASILRTGNNVLITILKHHDHISHISNIFSSPSLSKYPTLIIDDEGDQASLNTNPKKKKQSSTYREIIQLKNTFQVYGFVAYTATPQANLLIETFDELSPEYCVLVEPGEGYTGGSTFHGIYQDKYMRVIPEGEIPFDSYIPDSFVLALSDFLVGSAIRNSREDNGYHSMLVHTSGSKKDHHKVGSMVEALIENWKSILKLENNDPARNNLDSILINSLNGIHEQEDKIFMDHEELLTKVCREIDDLKLWIVNSSPQANNPSEKLNLKNNIFIGGNMLERGVTIEGLAVTYITRRAKISQSDTVEQRARWFGYKEKYLDVCRVYAPLNVKEGFADLLGDEDDLWKTLILNEKQNIPIKEWTRIIRCSKHFRPTRSNVARTTKLNISNALIHDYVEINEQLAINNLNITRDFFRNLDLIDMDFGGTVHSVVSGYDVKTLLDKYLYKIKVSDESEIDLKIIKVVIERLLQTNTDLQIDVVLMNKGMERKRDVNSSNKIKTLMQGRNKKYVGDNHILDRRFHIQVNIVRPKNFTHHKINTIGIALITPDAFIEQVGRLVKGNGH